jgi:DNA (cytosine-5)-methyltransferase 1
MTAYYNEIDSYAAQWLRNLIGANLIAPGDVDERSIVDVRPDDIKGYTQCHFFAGIGVWSYALRRAGWADDRPVWTGSCPCQPFSTAGSGKGFADERHLWPSWFWLIEQSRPNTIFGEQAATKAGDGWIDLVLSDLEGRDYAIGVSEICSASVGAPHGRSRNFFVADADIKRRHRQYALLRAGQPIKNSLEITGRGTGAHAWATGQWQTGSDGVGRWLEPGLEPLAHGAPARVGRLRGYGNAINAEAAQAWIEAYLEGCTIEA